MQMVRLRGPAISDSAGYASQPSTAQCSTDTVPRVRGFQGRDLALRLPAVQPDGLTFKTPANFYPVK
jgi:hypothetical protein